MRWIRKSKPLWTSWFAWYPVDLGHDESVWWERVERCADYDRIGKYYIYRVPAK